MGKKKQFEPERIRIFEPEKKMFDPHASKTMNYRQHPDDENSIDSSWVFYTLITIFTVGLVVYMIWPFVQPMIENLK